MKRVLAVFLGFALAAAAAGVDLDRARDLYQRVDYQGALKVLLASRQDDPAALNLAGRCYFQLADFKKATEYFGKALAAQSDDSDAHLWLGRAWGRRAETSSPFTAPGYASKARQAFEKAAELNPKNVEALNDLFEYYLQAPGFLGGGVEKAQSVSRRIAELDAAEHSYAEAQLAEKRKEYQRAEQNLRRAVEQAPMQVGRLVDLAKFLSRQGKVQESEATFAKADKIAPHNPKVVFERAHTYVKQKRNLEVARQLLKEYLNLTLTPDDPPRREAEHLLREVSGG